MAVGVDYSLFYLRRAREERDAGHAPLEAIDIAAATSGRAVLVSGVTVMIAMAGMFLTGDATFMSFAMGTIIVVAAAMIGSLTVLPATMAALGTKVDRGRVPFLHRLKRADGESRFWNAILGRVLRRPKLSLLAATALLPRARRAGPAAQDGDLGPRRPAPRSSRSCRPTTASRPRSRATRSRRPWSCGATT
jgi:uncharacterized membrane protein YdfJ with MMPL/SSD domain